MRRSSVALVPGPVATITQFLVRLLPGPQFDERVQPSRDVEGADVGEVVAELLWSQAVHFFQVVEVLFDDGAVSDGFENLGNGGLGFGTEIGAPAIGVTHEHDADDTARNGVGRQEGLVGLDDFLAIQDEGGGEPAFAMAGAFGQGDGLLAVLGIFFS